MRPDPANDRGASIATTEISTMTEGGKPRTVKFGVDSTNKANAANQVNLAHLLQVPSRTRSPKRSLSPLSNVSPRSPPKLPLSEPNPNPNPNPNPYPHVTPNLV